jgi:hypothetical protein
MLVCIRVFILMFLALTFDKMIGLMIAQNMFVLTTVLGYWSCLKDFCKFRFLIIDLNSLDRETQTVLQMLA